MVVDPDARAVRLCVCVTDDTANSRLRASATTSVRWRPTYVMWDASPQKKPYIEGCFVRIENMFSFLGYPHIYCTRIYSILVYSQIRRHCALCDIKDTYWAKSRRAECVVSARQFLMLDNWRQTSYTLTKRIESNSAHLCNEESNCDLSCLTHHNLIYTAQPPPQLPLAICRPHKTHTYRSARFVASRRTYVCAGRDFIYATRPLPATCRRHIVAAMPRCLLLFA